MIQVLVWLGLLSEHKWHPALAIRPVTYMNGENSPRFRWVYRRKTARGWEYKHKQSAAEYVEELPIEDRW
ncbi:hypothetical protein ACVWZ6_005601 [Bradyrhizobium sp. GM6.1]